MTLDEILAEENMLLDVKRSTSTASTEEQRILNSFEEINRFIDRHNRKPGETDKPSVSERGLKMKLAGLLNNPDMHKQLRPHDRHKLLSQDKMFEPQTLDDILALDDDLLTTPQDTIFSLVHVQPAAAKTDEVSSRCPCEEFEQFKPLFDQCAREINASKTEQNEVWRLLLALNGDLRTKR